MSDNCDRICDLREFRQLELRNICISINVECSILIDFAGRSNFEQDISIAKSNLAIDY